MADYRRHSKPINFGMPHIDFALVHYFIAAAREGLLPEAVKVLVDARKEEKADG